MPKCCKSEEFGGWCEGEELFEYEGEHYCVFHLPSNSPDKPETDEFNKLVFTRIDQSRRGADLCNFGGVQFPGDISFSRYHQDNRLPQMSFNKATFSGTADFKSAAFKRDADFSSATFSGDADFRIVVFGGYADFNKATFNEGAKFIEAEFSGYADFSLATFDCNACFRSVIFRRESDFRSTSFNSDAYFGSAAFNLDVNFNSTTFNGYAYFFEAQFSWDAYFKSTIFSGDANFRSATFEGDTDFILAVLSGDANFSDAAYSRDAEFIEAEFRGETHFNGANFSGEVDFDEAIACQLISFYQAEFSGITKFKDISFINANFNACLFEMPAYFRRARFDKARFRDCIVKEHLEFDQADLSRVSLLDAPIDSLRFISCTWPQCRGINAVYDARRVEGRGYLPLDKLPNPHPIEKQHQPGKLSDLFRALKKKAKEEHDEALAGDWHYHEKEMQRINHRYGLSKLKGRMGRWWGDLGMFLMLQIYKSTSGFGESPGLALAWLLILVLAPILPWLYGLTGFDLMPDFAPIAWWSNEVFPGEPLRYLPLIKHSPDDTLSRGTKLWMGLWQALIYLQTAWAGLALRNKMRR
jgi:hypothetical protein